MKSTSVIGHLRKGKLKLVYPEKKVVAGGKIVIFFFISTLCYALLLRAAKFNMLAKIIWYLFQSNRGIVVKYVGQTKLQGSLVLFEVESEILTSLVYT